MSRTYKSGTNSGVPDPSSSTCRPNLYITAQTSATETQNTNFFDNHIVATSHHEHNMQQGRKYAVEVNQHSLEENRQKFQPGSVKRGCKTRLVKTAPSEPVSKEEETKPVAVSTETENIIRLDRPSYGFPMGRHDSNNNYMNHGQSQFVDAAAPLMDKEPILEPSRYPRNGNDGLVRKLPGVKRRMAHLDDVGTEVNLLGLQSSTYPATYNESFGNPWAIGSNNSPSYNPWTQATVPDFGSMQQNQRIRIAPRNDTQDVLHSRQDRFKPDLERQNSIVAHHLERAGSEPNIEGPKNLHAPYEPGVPAIAASRSSPPVQQSRRRPIIVDGCNLAFARSNAKYFDSQGIKVCVDYFLQKGFTDITVVVPEFRLKSRHGKNAVILRDLQKKGLLITSWSKRLSNGKWIASYDDRMILEIAHKRGGVIISNDRFRDLFRENPEWKATIDERVLGYRFMPGQPNEIMFPADPLGRFGPTLENFLRF